MTVCIWLFPCDLFALRMSRLLSKHFSIAKSGKRTKLFARLADRYPISVTRNLSQRNWIRDACKRIRTVRLGRFFEGSSPQTSRDRHSRDVDPVHWFLNDKDDTRSSFYLEDAATEFQVQGLELDWACVAWDGDLRFTDSGWTITTFAVIAGVNIGTRGRRYLSQRLPRPSHSCTARNGHLFPPGDQRSDSIT